LYLSTRAQVLHNSNVTSESHFITCGVPQELILGPLFWLIYVDPIKYHLTEANIILFADDTLLFAASESLPSLFKKMETALNEFVSWADSNYFTHNYSKTNYIVFSRIISIETDLKLGVGNSTIERIKTCRYLCFIVDENVSRKEHAKLVGNKLSRSLGVIRYLKFRFPKKILKWFIIIFFILICLMGVPYGQAILFLDIKELKSSKIKQIKLYLQFNMQIILTFNSKLLMIVYVPSNDRFIVKFIWENFSSP